MSDEFKHRRWHSVANRVKAGSIGAEVGVRGGRMSRHLLNLIPGLTLYMIDRWEVYNVEEDDGSKISKQGVAEWDKSRNSAYEIAKNFGKRAIVLENDSILASRFVPDNSLDFVFIDANHAYKYVKEDIAAWMPKVKPGGWLMGHDYSRPGVHDAVHELGLPVESDPDKVWATKLPEVEYETSPV